MENSRARRARPQCPWITGPGRGAGFGRLVGPARVRGPPPDKFRMQFPHDTNRCMLKNRRISTIRLQYLKYTPGNCMRNCWATEGPGCGAHDRQRDPRVTAITTSAKVAHNFPRSFFETTRKRCNPNDAHSMFEQAAGELRAKLLWRGPLHPLRATAPVTGHDTRSEGVHCLRIGYSTPSHKNKRGSCEDTGLAAAPAGDGKTTARQISHAIPPGHQSMHAQKPQNIND